jgi:predicted DNA-binding transcriptional regulator AlpA
MPARRPPHDIHVGVAEIAALTGVQRKTAVQWGQRKLLPKPCGCSISKNRAWRLVDIQEWVANPPARPNAVRSIRDDVLKRLQAGEPIDDLVAEIEARPA